jgi:catechol 2,3-dioxygenase-like lactoylglutathione lyase family enzyme
MRSPNILQLVLGTDNLPLAKHLYTSVFGFAPAGERLIYSQHNGEVMALGPWGGAMLAYLVGRQELLQLEFWTHTTPPQHALPHDWSPRDIGFCRFGIAVSDFDAVLTRLAGFDIAPYSETVVRNGLRRVCFRDPTLGIPVEVMEEGIGLPGGRDRYHDLDPAIVYATVSVPDLAESVTFFSGVIGLQTTDVELHSPADEASWGQSGAERSAAVLLAGTTFLELVEYERPAGRDRPRDDVLSSQGFKTVAVGFRDPQETGHIFDRVTAAGLDWTVAHPASHIGGNHVIGAVAQHLKTLSVPHELEKQFGFAPEENRWWRPPASGASQATPAQTTLTS